MKKYTRLFAPLALFLLLISGCEKEEIATPAEMITGKWIIQSSEILGQTVAGDGSYLIFNACTNNECSGQDYMASDSSSGTFTYDLNADATTIAIADSSSDGGNYNATWDILDLNETSFRIVGNTFLGSLKIEMVKE